jgi:hypothetical protein
MTDERNKRVSEGCAKILMTVAHLVEWLCRKHHRAAHAKPKGS